MGVVTLNYEDSMRVLSNRSASVESKLIAASAVVLFMAKAADQATSEDRAIVQRILRMAAIAIDEGTGDETTH